MATYTMHLYQVIDMRDGKIGLDDYPIYDEAHREVLNNLIKNTYMTREIGSESIDLWVHRLRTKMFQIMPFYNQLYESETLKFDPISSMLIKSKAERTATGEETADSKVLSGGTSASESRAVNSSLPSVELSGDGDYATDMTDSNGKTVNQSENDQKSTGNSKASEDTASETSGYQGDPNALLASHRETILNIDLDIVHELRFMFMTVWELPSSQLPLPFTPLPNL